MSFFGWVFHMIDFLELIQKRNHLNFWPFHWQLKQEFSFICLTVADLFMNVTKFTRRIFNGRFCTNSCYADKFCTLLSFKVDLIIPCMLSALYQQGPLKQLLWLTYMHSCEFRCLSLTNPTISWQNLICIKEINLQQIQGGLKCRISSQRKCAIFFGSQRGIQIFATKSAVF